MNYFVLLVAAQLRSSFLLLPTVGSALGGLHYVFQEARLFQTLEQFD